MKTYEIDASLGWGSFVLDIQIICLRILIVCVRRLSSGVDMRTRIEDSIAIFFHF